MDKWKVLELAHYTMEMAEKYDRNIVFEISTGNATHNQCVDILDRTNNENWVFVGTAYDNEDLDKFKLTLGQYFEQFESEENVSAIEAVESHGVL